MVKKEKIILKKSYEIIADFGHLLLFVLAYPVLFISSFMPVVLAVSIGKWTGRLVFYLDRRHRLICLDNLKIAFPHHSGPERWTLARSSFENIGKNLMEVLGFFRQTEEELLGRVRVVGKEHYDKAVKKKKGVLLLTGHIGNWELLALSYRLISDRLAFVVRPLDNPYFDRWLFRLRTRGGNRVILKHGALLSVYRALRQKYDVGLLMDQRVSVKGSGGINVDFFNHKTGSSIALALLASRSGSSVVPIYMHREPDGIRHILCIEAEVPILPDGKKKENIVENTQRIQTALENIIRKHPEQWFWMHRRWKKSPTAITRIDKSQRPD